MPKIKFENVCLGYDGKTILENIDFEINSGDYLCIVGENGAGKTTVVKALAGINKPYGGCIKSDFKKVGYLPQQTTLQKDFPASVYEVILSGCINNHPCIPFYLKKDKLLCRQAAEKMEVDSLLKNSFSELSGGQKQRVLLARALCAAGNLLIMDEPAAGLDPIITNELYDQVLEINKKSKMTIVMISHDIEAATKYASHILHISNGSYWFGTTSEYLNSSVGKKFTGGGQNE